MSILQSFRARPAVRYGQCWEDADILMEGLAPQAGETCLSIGSAGDNSLALLSRAPRRVIVVDYDPVQIACLQLRIAAFRELEHGEMLELLGAQPSTRRQALYARCRPALSPQARNVWDGNAGAIASGIVYAGRLDRYFSHFRRWVLPLAHPQSRIARLFELADVAERRCFYRRHWNTWRWRSLFGLFFSRWYMARAGRDPACFRFAPQRIGAYLLGRVERALTLQDPAKNPYLRWILTGRYGEPLPFAWRPEQFDAIRACLDRITIHCAPLERVLAGLDEGSIDRFNLSDVFEYLSPPDSHRLLARIARVAGRRARIAYWNLFVNRTRPPALAESIRPLDDLARRLHRRDKTFFYRRFVLEETGCL